MPKYDLNEVLRTAEPWNCQVDDGGVLRDVREISLADVRTMSSLHLLPEEQAFAFLRELFVDNKDVPPMPETWEPGRISALLGIIKGHYEEMAAKKFQAGRDHVKTVLAAKK